MSEILPLNEDSALERRFNFWGRVPVIGSIVGIARVLYGIAMIIFNAIAGLFQTQRPVRTLFFGASLSGFKVLGKGVIQMIPIIGNFASCIFLRKKSSHLTFAP